MLGLLAMLSACPKSEAPPPEGTAPTSTQAGAALDTDTQKKLAEAAAREGMAPRLDLIADLAQESWFGLGLPADPAAVIKVLGEPRRNDATVWSWPLLGLEAALSGGKVVRLTLFTRTNSLLGIKHYPGQLLLSGAPFTAKSRTLTLRDVTNALGLEGRLVDDAKGKDAPELGWRRGPATLYAAFIETDLGAFVLEPKDDKLWDSMKPLPAVRARWDIDPVWRMGPDVIELYVAPGRARPSLPGEVELEANLPSAKVFFDTVAMRFLKPGEQLQREKGKRIAALRVQGTTILAVEGEHDSWSASCATDSDPHGLGAATLKYLRDKLSGG